MARLATVKKSFQWAIDKGLLRFVTEEFNEYDHDWFTVEYHETLTAEGKDWKWSHLCSQSISEYKKSIDLVNRITLMLAEKARSNRQDVNIYRNEIENGRYVDTYKKNN